MAGYEDTRQKIISTLMGRPNGTEIQPENHQDYALNMLDYIRSLELIATSTLIGVAESNTTPVQPDSSRVCYIAGVAQNQTVTFENFIGQDGNPISVTTGDMEGVFILLMWNTQYWSSQTFSTNIISHAESATFYYRYNIRKTYASIALMNADVASPIGTDGKYIKVGDIVTVVNSDTPSENGIYSYEGATDGWKYQSSFNFQLSQTTGSDPNISMSQKAITNALSLYNVTSLFPLPSGYYSHESAVLAIPVGERIKGLIITYETASGVWYTERFISTNVSGWTTLSNWEKVPDASDVAQLRSDLNEMEAKTNEVDSRVLGDSFVLSDKNGNVIFKVDSDGVKSKKYNICDADGNVLATVNKEIFQTVYADKEDSNNTGVVNNYKGQFILSDANGNVIFKVDSDGVHSSGTSEQLIFEQITTTIAKVHSSTSYSKVFFRESKLAGKTFLAIGDSLTAANKWQVKAAEILGCTQVTHALGGAGVITFVDGDGSFAALNSSDVAGKDAIVILGPYNNRTLMGSIGVKTDMYPTQQTLWGQMNYLFKRIYQELAIANNLKCKIFFAGVHAFGAGPYIQETAYQEFPSGSGYTGSDFNNKLKEICGWNGIEYIDLFNNSGINSYTWNKYQVSSQPNAINYIGYSGGRGVGVSDPFPDLTTLNNSIVSSGFINGDRATVTGFDGYYTFNGTSFVPTTLPYSYYPWLGDQLHCNNDGYDLIGNYIASQINKFINN